jgi:hypothetical protein
MTKGRFTLGCAAVAAVAAMASVTRSVDAANPGLTVHEWGTFTSIAGPNGQAIGWRPVSGPQDLPCFVTELTPNAFRTIKFLAGGDWLKSLSAKIRMETPVLYFYSDRDAAADVRVRFPQGLVTEWYPSAAVTAAPGLPGQFVGSGSIEWKGVKVSPRATPAYLKETGASHYYAARATDAAPIQVGTQWEKFLFYRGIGEFTPPVSLVQTSIAFENRGGRIGYRIARAAPEQLIASRLPLDKSLASLKADLTALLIKEGLFPREAAAMVETWRDSWFEQGRRVFYLIPRATVDQILPLDISPAPARVERAFVGRLEVLTDEMYDDVERAIATNDLDTLNHYGRFLEPIAQRVAARPSLTGKAAQIQSALKSVASSHPPRVCR